MGLEWLVAYHILKRRCSTLGYTETALGLGFGATLDMCCNSTVSITVSSFGRQRSGRDGPLDSQLLVQIRSMYMCLPVGVCVCVCSLFGWFLLRAQSNRMVINIRAPTTCEEIRQGVRGPEARSQNPPLYAECCKLQTTEILHQNTKILVADAPKPTS